MTYFEYSGPDPNSDTRTWDAIRQAAPPKWSEFLVGRRIHEIGTRRGSLVFLVLDDGTRVDLEGISACCANYRASEVATEPFDGVIMSVLTTVNDDAGLETAPDDRPRIFRLFVYGQDGTQQQIARFDGSDGTGYYGTGFTVTVSRVVEGSSK